VRALPGGLFCEAFGQGGDEFGAGAAAAAQEAGAGFEQGRGEPAEFFGGRVISRAAVDDVRQAGVWFDPNWPSSSSTEAFTDWDKAGDALAAIGADDVGTFLCKSLRRLLGGGAHDCSIHIFATVKNHRGNDWQAGLAGSADGQFRFVQIGHGFNQQRIGAAVGQGLCLLEESGPYFVRADFTAEQQFSGGTHRGEDQGTSGGGLARNRYAALVDLCNLHGGVVLGESDPVAAKSIGQNDPTAGLDVCSGYLLDFFGLCEIPNIGKVTQAKAEGLQLSAPCAIRNDGAAVQKLLDEHGVGLRDLAGLGCGEGSLGQRNRTYGALAVAIGANFVGVLLSDGRAADEDFDMIAHARLF